MVWHGSESKITKQVLISLKYFVKGIEEITILIEKNTKGK